MSTTTSDTTTTTDTTATTDTTTTTNTTADENDGTTTRTTDGITDTVRRPPPPTLPPPPSDVPPRGKADLASLLRAMWGRLRDAVRKLGGLFTVAVVCMLAACDRGASSASVGGLVTSCPPAPGSISLAWSLAGSNGQPASCSTAGARSVALRLRSRSGGPPVFTAFPCADAQGVANVPPDVYDVAIELHDAKGAKIATAPGQTAVAVAAGRTKPLAPVGFSVNQGGGGGGGGGPPGSVLISLQAQGFTSNCPNVSDGAGISGTSITLEASDGGCAPVTFIRNDGGAQIGTYNVNCGAPSVTTCIENSEILTSPDLTPGTYVMHVRGKRGPVDCWAADTTLVVPLPGQPPLRQRVFMQLQPGC